jgi:AmmeMemoRadiSam system protein B
LERAEKDLSSCSAGSVLGALGFTGKDAALSPKLLDYRTSADIDGDDMIPDSFVGYAAVVFGAT